MPAPASRDKPLARAGSLVLVGLLAVSCTSSGGTASPSAPCESPTPITLKDPLPPGIPLDDYGEVVAAGESKGFRMVEVVTEQQIVAVDPPLQRAILDAGYEILSHDNEGFEAEIFFARSSKSVGTIIMREGPCEGQATLRLRLSLDKDARS